MGMESAKTWNNPKISFSKPEGDIGEKARADGTMANDYHAKLINAVQYLEDLQRLSMAEQRNYEHNVYIHCCGRSKEAKKIEQRIDELEEQKAETTDFEILKQIRADIKKLENELSLEVGRVVEACIKDAMRGYKKALNVTIYKNNSKHNYNEKSLLLSSGEYKMLLVR